jgi:hypothetical protein
MQDAPSIEAIRKREKRMKLLVKFIFIVAAVVITVIILSAVN